MQGETWSKAADYLLKSAAKARGQFNYGEAARSAPRRSRSSSTTAGSSGDLAAALEALGDLESLRSGLEPANAAYDRALALADEPSRTADRQQAPSTGGDHAGRGPDRLLRARHRRADAAAALASVYGIGTFQLLLELLCEEFRILTIDPRG